MQQQESKVLTMIAEAVSGKKHTGVDSCPCGGKYGYLTPLGKRSQFACTSCHFPAPADHPLVIKLARDYAELEEKKKAEASRPRPPSGMGGLVYGDTANTYQREAASLRAEVAALREEVTALKNVVNAARKR